MVGSIVKQRIVVDNSTKKIDDRVLELERRLSILESLLECDTDYVYDSLYKSG